MSGAMLAPALAAAIAWGAPVRPAKASLRGLAVVSPRVVWASGTGGTVLRTTDGGLHWEVEHVAGAEREDFRDIKAFDADTAYAMAVGATGGIYKTTDGGAHWRRQYHSDDPHFFLDSLAFWDARHGLALGDPMEGRFLVLRTDDGGGHWTRVEKLSAALPGEGGFAASGTSLVAGPDGRAWFATGSAAHARVFLSTDRGRSWTAVDTPLGNGTAGSGIFSLAFRDRLHGIAVGGDYTHSSERAATAAVTNDGGRTWTLAASPPGGYRSGAAWVPGHAGWAVAVGTNGADLSTDGGMHWRPSSALNLNAVAAGADGRGWAVGGRGLVAGFAAEPH